MNSLRSIAAVLALTPALFAGAQQAGTASFSAARDASWAKNYAASCGTSNTYCTPSSYGDENGFTWNSRFLPLMRASFPQHQWFWFDKGHSMPLPELVQKFIGEPGTMIVDQDRYVTADGCVPHVCELRGMLWIDTGVHPAGLIFVAVYGIYSGVKGSPDNVLWVFSSSKLNWQKFPKPFLASLHRWRSNLLEQDGFTFQNGFAVANLVQPNGEIVTLSPSVLGLQPLSTGAKQ